MAHTDGSSQHWDDERAYTSGSHSDDSPILSYRYEKYRRYVPYAPAQRPEERERRSTFTVLAKFFLFCTAMILFFVLMYIPVYNKANYQMTKGLVPGWSIHTNRDTKIYVQPNNVTTIHEPKDVCAKHSENKKNKLFLLIIVCSSTLNFERRNAIRETWGNYTNYLKTSKIFHIVRDKYKNYNFSYDLYPRINDYRIKTNATVNVNGTDNSVVLNVTGRKKRDISTFSKLLPELAKALQSNLIDTKTELVPEEKRFDDDDEDDAMLPEFDMNKELGEHTEEEDLPNYDEEYESNIMKIPPKGYEENQDLGRILTMLKHAKTFPKVEDVHKDVHKAGDIDFKLAFLLGMPANDNDTDVQGKIEDEIKKHGDIIQEDFIDSYNNLTLKSIMMLKWVTNNCADYVRYILKTDDDMYINVPNLMLNLRNRSKTYETKVQKGYKEKEYLLIGDLICGARPVLDSHNKWYSPRYMYWGRVYPRYLSGTGYALSLPAAQALYAAALRTPYFHLEDIYITGMCSLRATPRITPRDDPQFSYMTSRGGVGACAAHAQVTAHRVPPRDMRALQQRLASLSEVHWCEIVRLTQIRRDRMRPKNPPKKVRTDKKWT